MSNLNKWIENINETTLCKHRKAKAIAGITRELEEHFKLNRLAGFSPNSSNFSLLFNWKNTPEGHPFWSLVRDKLSKSGRDYID